MTNRLAHQVRRGAYHDSVMLMGLQRSLEELPGVEAAAAVMGTQANLDLLGQRDLRPPELSPAAEDLVVAVRGETEGAARDALGRVDELLAARRGGGGSGSAAYRPKTLESARRLAPDAGWVAVSVPGRHAGRVVEDALGLGLHVFLFSDNVTADDERRLKSKARDAGLLVLGPDCGTASLGGVGFGFANRVRRGPVSLVAASGTGLQTVACALDAAGVGIRHAVGLGGRDLTVGDGTTALQALDLLGRDDATEVLVVLSKPPDRAVSRRLLAAARATGKPTVLCLLGEAPPTRRIGRLHFAVDLDDAADLARRLAAAEGAEPDPSAREREGSVEGFLRGLFSGGTLATVVARGLAPFLDLSSNLSLPGVTALDDVHRGSGHTVVDLGDDAFTVGRLHPMMDPALVVERLRREAADAETGLILLDVVLGDGAHEDPASVLAPAIREARERVEVLVLLMGSEEDPQGTASQREAFEAAGARVVTTVHDTLDATLAALAPASLGDGPSPHPVPLDALSPRAILNVGLAHFADAFTAQGVAVQDLDWKPPAAGNEKMAGLLARLKKN